MPQIAVRVVRSRSTILEASQEAVKLMGVALDKEAKPMLIKQFDEVVANWEHKPVFKARKFIRPDKISIDVFPSGENAKYWQWTSRGTKRHKIRAKNAPTLKFMTDYKPKTAPGGRWGGPGVSTGPWRSPIEVDHPGTKARKFEEDIAKTQKDEFSRITENAWRRIIRTMNTKE